MNKIYDVPADYAQWKFWEVVENPPEIRAPEPKKEDSVFKDEVFLPPTEVTSSAAPTPILSSSLRVGEVAVSEPEPKVTTPTESVVTQVEISSETIGVPKTNPITELIIHEPGGDKTIPVLATILVELETHDDKPAQEDKNVVMEAAPVEKNKDVMEPLTEDGNSGDDEYNGMPPELLAEMRSLGEELPGEQPPQRKRRIPKKTGV